MGKEGRNQASSSSIVALIFLLQPFALRGIVEAKPLPGTDSCRGCGKLNVVVVMCDSFDGRLTFYPGNETVILPFINLMKRDGSLFLNAYTNSPICCPSRAAMWSGLFNHLTESWNNFKGLDPNYTTWMNLMEKHGYYTQKYGKIDYTSGHHSLSNRVEAWTRNVDFLLQQEGENHGASTFLTSPYWLERVKYKAIRIPKWSPFSELHPVDYYSSYTKNCTGKFTQKEIRDIRAHYYAMCAETDAMLGEIISALNETGLLKNTLIIFTADHGELAMEHRQFYKMSMYEASSHIPLLIMGPSIKSQHISGVVSLVDIYPTLLDAARIPIPKNLSGYSLLPLILEKTENNIPPRKQHPGWVLSEFHGCNVNSSTYMLRTGKWKYIAYSDDHSVSPQLFDLSADPDELTNVATKFPKMTQSLNRKLHSIIDYPKVSALVEQYNKQEFIKWKHSVEQNYSDILANLRWHQDWKKHPKKYEYEIDKWIKGNMNV
ncbi:arylsulfatase K isoform X2 [Sphaerodactylus townsendi]|uniref:arylsulfatase K isoform X2 n=1 Tax=Sphaerodactylus townsendi TaxID=933632 RepID=UPI002026D0E4|nr:arylsulfatase K isoform X2 [Sphaerodactylus townsendi]